MSKCLKCDNDARTGGALCWTHTMGLVLHARTLQDFTMQSADLTESAFDADNHGDYEPNTPLFENLLSKGAA